MIWCRWGSSSLEHSRNKWVDLVWVDLSHDLPESSIKKCSHIERCPENYRFHYTFSKQCSIYLIKLFKFLAFNLQLPTRNLWIVSRSESKDVLVVVMADALGRSACLVVAWKIPCEARALSLLFVLIVWNKLRQQFSSNYYYCKVFIFAWTSLLRLLLRKEGITFRGLWFSRADETTQQQACAHLIRIHIDVYSLVVRIKRLTEMKAYLKAPDGNIFNLSPKVTTIGREACDLTIQVT